MEKCVAYKRRQARLRRHKRLRKKVIGSAERPRLSLFRSLKNLHAQIIDDAKGNTILSISSLEKELKSVLEKKTKIEKSKILGEYFGDRAKAKGINSVVFDKGGFKYMGRIKAFADGVRSKGIIF